MSKGDLGAREGEHAGVFADLTRAYLVMTYAQDVG